jgi:phosphomannomutase
LSAGDAAAGATVPPGIFKAYDIRGLYGKEMNGDTAWLVGRAFARVLARLRAKDPGELRIGLGRDMRVEAPEMARRVRAGLVAERCAVL